MDNLKSNGIETTTQTHWFVSWLISNVCCRHVYNLPNPFLNKPILIHYLKYSLVVSLSSTTLYLSRLYLFDEGGDYSNTPDIRGIALLISREYFVSTIAVFITYLS